MSSLTTSTDLPPAIRTSTVEKVFAWAGLTLFQLFKANLYKELENALGEKVIDMSILTAADGTERLLIRGSLPLDPNWRASTSGKLWTYVQEFGTTAVPAAYKVD